ncbi:MAG: MG2 domain-containing protein [Chloroflexi bacterium]|nr:MG2 domain-containing protein [Chloroflexota bacterium]
MKKSLYFLSIIVIGIMVILCGVQCKAGPGIGGFELQVMGQNRYLADSAASLRIITFNPVTNRPVGQVPVAVKLYKDDEKKAVTLAEGVTETGGSWEGTFKIPADIEGNAKMKVEAGSGPGVCKVETNVTIERMNKVYLTTDKPLYQPNQTIHIRALALSIPSLLPCAGQEIIFEVEDAKGNKVFKEKKPASKFGIASADFTLADEVNMGEYHIRAVLGGTESEKSVTVKKYVLPKFKLAITPDKKFYMPGQTVKGTLQVDYFFGKPVAKGKIKIQASTFDVAWRTFGEITGETGKNGAYNFEIKLPDYLVGQPLEKGKAVVKLDFNVTDTANHAEKKTLTLPITSSPISIDVFPESGKIQPGLDNDIMLMASYPDGSPAKVIVEIEAEGSNYKVSTDETGWGVLTLMGSRKDAITLQIKAADNKGNTADLSTTLLSTNMKEGIILRPDRPLYVVGDTAHFEVITTAESGTVYLDAVKNSQTVLTRTLEIHQGRALMDMDISPDLAGMVVFRAYRILPSQDIVRDVRNVYVRPANNLMIKITADKNTYRPGQEAKVNFAVSDESNKPVLSALGVEIVDESLFELGEKEPGLERVYFLLEKQLMEPKYEIHGVTLTEDILNYKEDARQKTTTALFSKIEDKDPYTWKANSYDEKLMTLLTRMDAIRNALYSYREKHGSYPDSALPGVLVREGFLKNEDTVDPWGHEFRLVPGRDKNEIPDVVSAGPDGTWYNADDIKLSGISEGKYSWTKDFMMRNARARGGRMVDKMMVEEGNAPFKAFRAEFDMAMPMAAAMPTIAGKAQESKQPARVREYFPETLYFNPQVITDEQGRADVTLTMADSITTWRLSAFASSLFGAMGNTTSPMRVFQDFFIDIDLPVTLTQNDEISIPVAVYNYLPEKQAVKLTMEKGEWFKLLDETVKTIELEKDQVSVAYFRIKVVKLGVNRLTVHAEGSKLSDAIRRSVEVVPDGELHMFTKSDRLNGPVTVNVPIPKNTIPDSARILVTIYPGVISQIVDGLDKILQMPFGCFEQTSSATYPNIMVLDYMKKTKKITPEIQMKAEGYINTGYQRLLSFEVPGGGFSWFGDAPANKILTAFGVMEFNDMSKVHEVDPAVISRTQEWLASRQEKDGSWAPDASYLHQESWSKIQNSNLPVSAYITWGLAESGYKGPALDRAREYIAANWKDVDDPYVLSLVANALASTAPQDKITREVIDKLAGMAKKEKDEAYWETKMSTATFSHGEVANIETTALATLALLRAGVRPDLAGDAINYIIRHKDPQGTWHSTQATTLCLKALLVSQEKGSEGVQADITVTCNGEGKQALKITSENYDVFRQVDFKPQTRTGDNTVGITFTGKGNCFYQVTGKYYLPWEKGKPGITPLSIDLKYDRTTLKENDTASCDVTVRNNTIATMNMVMIDLGIPPGFTLVPDNLNMLVKQNKIKKYNTTSRQIIIYLEKLDPKQELKFSYQVKAKFPLKAKTPESKVYQYYNPEVGATAVPVELEVKK